MSKGIFLWEISESINESTLPNDFSKNKNESGKTKVKIATSINSQETDSFELFIPLK